MELTRRQVLILTVPAVAAGQASQVGKLKVVCVGAHPDDPESGCGGTLARYSAGGHHVTILYLTRGEAGIRGKSHDEAAAIRSAECEASCKILDAKPVFAGQVDGATVVDANAAASFGRFLSAEQPDVVLTQWPNAAASFGRFLSAEQPDVVLTQWPIDTHLDHQAASTLTFRAWLAGGRRFDLFYYEVNLGSQTMGFHPTEYVDITSVRERKKAALFAHKSQNGEEIYRRYHGPMEDLRGRESGCAAAEAFVHLARSTGGSGLPGLG